MDADIDYFERNNEIMVNKLKSGKDVSKVLNEQIDRPTLPGISFDDLQSFRKSHYDYNEIDKSAFDAAEHQDKEKQLSKLAKLALNGISE